MKKNYLLTLLLIVLCSNVFAQSFFIKGDIKGISCNSVYITVFGDEDACSITFDGENPNTCKVENGVFLVNGKTTEPCVVRLSFQDDKFVKWIGQGFIPVKSSNLWVIVSPDSEISINGDLTDKNFVDLYYTGDSENKIYAELLSKLMPVTNKKGDLIVKAKTDKTLSDSDIKVIIKEMEGLEKEEARIREIFVKENPSSIAALWLIEDMLVRSQIDIPFADSLISMVDDKYKDNYFYKTVYDRVKGAKSTSVGSICPVIEGLDIDGNKFSTDMLKGKYIIIDFWGTWCGACLSGMPAMKQFRDENADKVQIVGIANDKDVELWKKCIERNKMDWPNIMQGSGEQDYVSKFNVQGFPTKIFVGPDGKILLRAVGETDEFYSRIKEIINKN